MFITIQMHAYQSYLLIYLTRLLTRYSSQYVSEHRNFSKRRNSAFLKGVKTTFIQDFHALHLLKSRYSRWIRGEHELSKRLRENHAKF